MTPRLQRTLGGTAEASGFGYWSSLDVTLRFYPAPPDTGIVFVRTDLPGRPRIPAHVRYRHDVPRRTNLLYGPGRVDMVEHVLAALAGLQVDNCEVWCDNAEMPGPDGSSRPFVDAIQAATVVEQNVLRRQVLVTDPIRVEANGAWVQAEPYNGFCLEYNLDYEHTAIGKQSLRFDVTPESFLSTVADARTFILEAEANWLREQGLGLRASNQDLLVFGPNGPIDNQLRHEDECVRHKTLDMVGDLALGGCDFVGKFTAHRSGHKLNAELVCRLLASESTTVVNGTEALNRRNAG